jgi:hypothetical protein
MAPPSPKPITAPGAGDKILAGLIDFLTIAKAGVVLIGISSVAPGLEPAVNGVLQFLTMIEVRWYAYYYQLVF